jgi:hypothetical protein
MRFTSSWPRLPAGSRTGLAALLLLVLSIPLLFADAAPSIRFTWALACRDRNQQARTIDYSESIVHLNSGDRIKLYLRPLSPCYFYVYLYDSQKRLRLLFPEEAGSGQIGQVGKNLSLPPGQDWFYLDEHGGIELFYLIASDHRLPRLEGLTEKYSAGKAGRSGLHPSSKHKVLGEIKRIIKQSSKLAEAAQQPIPVAGDLRGITEESEVPGIGVEANNIYVKTIRLEH